MSSSSTGSVADAEGVAGFAPRPRLPPLRPSLLPCGALHDRLSAFDGTVILVCGAGGYGKTTLIRQWIENDPRPTAWVTLRTGDDDPLILARHLIGALHDVQPLPEAVVEV